MTIPVALDRAHAHWNAGQAVQAEQLCLRVLAAWPGQSDALHLLGLIAHAYGNLDLAISHLREACKVPGAPAIYFSNLAEMCRQKGLLSEGEAAAQRAVELDPTLVAGWNNLGILLQEAGKMEQSLACLERVVALKPDWADAHNNLGNTWRRLGRLDHAEVHYRHALALNPSYAIAHSNLAFLLCSKGHYDDAAAEARFAIDLDPSLADAYLNLAEVELSRRRTDAVLATLNALHAFAPQHPQGLVARARALTQFGRIDEALEFARQAVALAPHHAEAHNVLGQALQSQGRIDEALSAFETAAGLPGTVAEEALISRAHLLMEAGRKEEALAGFERALATFPGSVRALASRAHVKTFEADDADIVAMEAVLAETEGRPLPERIDAHFALGKAYLDTGDAQRAFHHFDSGNRQKRASITYDATATAGWMKRIAETLTPERLAGFQGAGAPSDLPVFVIGMPRSGTTLIEQIVSSHPQVTGGGELSVLRSVIEGRGAFPDSIGTMTRDDAAHLGHAYLARVNPLALGRLRLVDKMPANFFYTGLIPAILPGARIIHCRRDPVDTCLSCYTRQFGGEQPFTFDQAELGAFYRSYEGLMAHLRDVLPAERFIEVDYESVVDDLEGEARRLIAFLGLPWDDACLNFHENRRVVRTASVDQVRQPIYKTSRGRGRQYADHLGPLLSALGVDIQ
ncbi:tetratricopeptide (TPR) repeat protein [Paraburkholderia bryophila]|uniref:Tetratricopeptide (TPR) repeat protein n=3 Tax=Burkholderiaceae TaxID=119060 RepID=A0A7Z0B879_9BURK|nr:tetratricopeptide repeat-containing sulfotransferase family protein [Paraburkholderia bryophila]NYH23943.1 tetratricopeptide (TPR) repeat protein [Paraburkholderia bryophila]